MQNENQASKDGFVYWLGVGAVIFLVAFLAIGFLIK